MRGPIVYATLIVVLAIVPVFFLTGLTGSFFQPLAFSYALAAHDFNYHPCTFEAGVTAEARLLGLAPAQ